MRLQAIFAALLLAVAADLWVPMAGAQLQAQQQVATNIVFIHTAGQPIDGDAVVAVLKALLQAGYSLRKPDTDGDVVGGPGVDYFYDDDLPAAQSIADIVNRTRPDTARKLTPRRQ